MEVKIKSSTHKTENNQLQAADVPALTRITNKWTYIASTNLKTGKHDSHVLIQIASGRRSTELGFKQVEICGCSTRLVGELGLKSTTRIAILVLVFCWGWNKYGQLGLGDVIDCNIPSQVALEGCVPRTVACGWWHILLLAESLTRELIDSNATQSKAYQVLLKAHEAAVGALKPGNKASAVYKAAYAVVEKEAPEFLTNLTKSAGTGISLEFRESGLSLNEKNERILKAWNELLNEVCYKKVAYTRMQDMLL
ncbi:Peptidase M24, structural domain-containing protein, partial [Cynara cardunculus var. scolymus]